MSRRSYCVVGGGISGLTAAYRLRAAAGADATITVFDPADRLGGILRTELVGGQPMDVGAEAFVLRRPEMPALLAELGLAEHQRATTGARPLIYSQQLHALPTGTVMGIPSSAASLAGLVDDATVARIEGEPGRRFSWRQGSDPAVAELVADRFGEQTVARSVDPLLCGVYAGSAATIGLRAAAPGVAAALDHGAASLTDAVRQALPPAVDGPVFGALDGGYQVLVDDLVARSRLNWVRAAVTQLEPGWELNDETGARWHADAVILAIPAPRLVRLLAGSAGLAPRSVAAAGRITSASSAVVALAVPLDTPFPQCSGVLVASGEQLRAKAITLSSRKWGPRGDSQLLRLSFGRFGDDLVERASDEELLAWALDDLATVFGVTVDPIEYRVQRWIEAMPQYGPGHADLVAEVRAGLPSGLAVAGSYLDGIGVPACVAAAGLAVTGIVEAL
ncbi:protoporphyrinogen oxidase [Mycobacterium kansasii 732]|uniref:Coproporphyrinogen III oxidase n=1 Tax=Mycobacterium pseudokansasii TaxID=2341080 RepID=A0A498QQ03_9MYCO|nr:protoporphyrinogen oxidase [Mycobacterium pseudokansasii]EUA09566.1 protoporphyrinogen oxidase [Mycobacterium kansasii 732]KZS59230.1 protoporphyrinogen oxidase [Mycobacterium kansasii]MBY0388744.1 protoporphyrinogen oxidase [Mycobacterium pseudokansasii]VAZ93297.1 Protoporphyrinogen oxidase [Mycobacterium pseudokansasii]VAZ94244.1 Protoporphyrinogen oxidase [Mycobacterium pseudokansasii]